MKSRISATFVHATATVLGALVVIVGAWSISTSIGRTRPATISPQLRTLHQQRVFTGRVEQLPTTDVSSHAAGVASLVLMLPGQSVAAGEAIAELDREPLIAELITIQKELIALGVHTSKATLGSGSNIVALRKNSETIQQQEQKALQALRSSIEEYRQKLATIGKEIGTVSGVLTLPGQTSFAGIFAGDLPQDLSEALMLVHSALEGSILSQTLTVSDIRTFFGSGNTTESPFLKALPKPQAAVPFWEKLLESERLKDLIESRIKASAEFSDSQEALQLLLTSKALTQMSSDILQGLTGLLSTIESSDQFSTAEIEAQSRLLARNTSSMTTLLETLKIHEERLVTLLGKYSDARQEQIEEQQNARTRFVQLSGERATLLQQGAEIISKQYTAVQAIRNARARALEEQVASESGIHQSPSPVVSPAKSTTLLQEREQSLQTQLEQGIIRSPSLGVVTALSVAVGDSVASGQTVATLSARQPIVHVEVKEPLALVVGQFIDVVVGDSRHPEHFAGEIQAVTSVGDHETRFSVGIRSVEGFLKSVQDATVTVGVTLSTPRPVLAIPASSIMTTAHGSMVSIVEPKNNTSKSQTVATGFQGDDGWVEIIQGLTQKDSIVAQSSP